MSPHSLRQLGGKTLLAASCAFFLSFTYTYAADMNVSVTNVQPELNRFYISLSIETGAHEPFNAAQATIHIPDSLRVVDVSYDTSVFDLWITKPMYAASSHTISFAGGTTRPGGFILNATILTAVLEYTGPGTFEFSLDDALILAHDGKGTDILERTHDAEYVVDTIPEHYDTNNDGVVSLNELSVGMAEAGV